MHIGMISNSSFEVGIGLRNFSKQSYNVFHRAVSAGRALTDPILNHAVGKIDPKLLKISDGIAFPPIIAEFK